MARKILSGTLIALSTILFILSVAGIGIVWIYRQPLTLVATTRLQKIDQDLEQAGTDFQNARLELERTLRLVEAAESSMKLFKDEFTQVKTIFDNTKSMLDKQLLPGLIDSRGKIDQAKSTLQGLRDTLSKINSLPLLDLNLPGEKLLGDLIAGADSLDTQIVHVEDMVKIASTFVSDTSYLMGGDFSETKANLQDLLTLVKAYEQKLTDWRSRIAALLGTLPGWILGVSIGLTVFLCWFGFSQISLILHGLSLWQGYDPFTVLRKPLVDRGQG
jgi:hypothetical protein